MEIESGTRALALLRRSLEMIEAKYLALISRDRGWPIFWLSDLTDPHSLGLARSTGDGDVIDGMLADGKLQGNDPFLVYHKMLDEPYTGGDHYWSTAPIPEGCFPALVFAEGRVSVFAVRIPEGVPEAQRRRTLAEHRDTAVEAARIAKGQGLDPVVVLLADLLDEGGKRAVIETHGTEAVAYFLERGAGASEAIVTFAGGLTSKAYPAAWGDIEPGHVAVQVLAHGGVLLETLDITDAAAGGPPSALPPNASPRPGCQPGGPKA